MRCLIALNGAPPSRDRLIALKETADLTVAADAGARIFLNNGMIPDVMLGDMDSSQGHELADLCTRLGSRVLFYRPKKDATDGHLALDYCLGQGADGVTFVGACGGRTDMILANIGLLLRAHRAGLKADAYGQTEYLRAFDGRLELSDGVPGRKVSFFPLDAAVTLSLAGGWLYPLPPTLLDRADTLTVSNEFTSSSASALSDGACLMVRQL